jgi:tetratricopeptide (TPR) repeat protein
VIGERPVVAGLELPTKAELLLRVGSLSGWIGSARQMANAQEFAKDLIAESARIFAALGQQEKVVEAQTDLAICYWRAGALDEAAVWFHEAFSRATSVENKVRILINQSIVEIFSNELDRAMRLLNEVAPLLDKIKDHATHGRYHMQRAIAFKRKGGNDNLDHALIENAAASFHLEKARHTRYLARVENNLGFILMELDRPEEALEHLNKAWQIFAALKDSGSAGQVNETRARLFLRQQKYDDAEQAAYAAIAALENGEEQSLISEALTTRGVALARLRRYDEAFASLSQAASIAEIAGDRVRSGRTRLIMVVELQQSLPAADLFKLYLEAEENIGDVPDAESLGCLRSASRIAVSSAQRALGVTTQNVLSSGSLKEELRRYEGELIRCAMDKAEGQITTAARMLGITHQALCEKLNSRHQGLRIKPPRSRQRSPQQA